MDGRGKGTSWKITCWNVETPSRWIQADLQHRNSWYCLAHHFAALAGQEEKRKSSMTFKTESQGVFSLKDCQSQKFRTWLQHDMTWLQAPAVFFPGMADCCKWLREQGLDLGATNNQGEDVFFRQQKFQVLVNFHAPRRSQCLAQGSIWWSCSIVFLVAGVAHREFPPDSIFEKMLEKSDTCFVIWFARIMLLWILIRRMWGTCFSVKSSHWTTDFSPSVAVGWEFWNLRSRGGKPVQPWQRRLDFRLGTDIQCIWVFPKIGFFPPQIIHFNRVFHCKSSILGYHYCWKPPFG